MKKRLFCLSLCMLFLFVGITGRIGYLSLHDYDWVSNDSNSYSLIIDETEVNLYYSNGGKATNNKNNYVAVIKPNAKCLSELNLLFSYNEQKEIRDELKRGYPVVRNVNKSIDTKYISIYKQKYSSNKINQFVSKSSSGLLYYTGDNIGEKKLNFSLDATGRMLQGDNGKIIDFNYYSPAGYKLSINSDIQDITYEASTFITNGCVIIMDVKSGNILSSVVKPDDSFINKSISQYAVGSVFKLVVASCAIENNIDLDYNCVGSILIGDTIFSCQKNKSHGRQTLKDALANSCNCYFVNLILHLGCDKIIDTAKKMGYYDKTTLFDNWNFSNANMPTDTDLKSLGELALLGFGQGKLTASPLQICSTICSIASSNRITPKLVIGTVNEQGYLKYYDKESPIKSIKSSTSKTMLKYMRNVVENGTGYNAETNTHKSAGKTATAETGQYINGQQVLNTWFAGVYPYDNPEYAIVIMCENGKSGAEDCCPIFSTIVEKLDTM